MCFARYPESSYPGGFFSDFHPLPSALLLDYSPFLVQSELDLTSLPPSETTEVWTVAWLKS